MSTHHRNEYLNEYLPVSQTVSSPMPCAHLEQF